MNKRKNQLLVSIILGLTMLGSSDSVYANQTTYDVMRGVNNEMLTSSYWCKDNASKQILMTYEEIVKFNQNNFTTPETNMNDLSALASTYQGIKLRDELISFEAPKELYKDGENVPEDYYENIRNNIKDADVKEQMSLQYGIITNRTVMKSLPCEEALSDSVDDPDWDELCLTCVQVNEPVVCYLHTADGKFSYVKSQICSGWIPSEDFAICKSKQEWNEAQIHEKFLVVTDDEIILETSYANPKASRLSLDMGTVLELCNESGMIGNRASWYNYVVYIPTRDEEGFYCLEKALISANEDVSIGFLELTKENICKQAYKCLGNRYGWGGSLDAQDCSAFVREIYLCFGLNLPRNTTWQAKMPVKVIDVANCTVQEKEAILDDVPLGAIVQFPGHEMLYMGKADGDYFTINNVSSLFIENSSNEREKWRVSSIVLNDLGHTYRTNGNSWMEEVSKVIIPWE